MGVFVSRKKTEGRSCGIKEVHLFYLEKGKKRGKREMVSWRLGGERERISTSSIINH